MKNIRGFLSENFQFLEVNFSIYLNMRVFVMIKFYCNYNMYNPEIWSMQWCIWAVTWQNVPSNMSAKYNVIMRIRAASSESSFSAWRKFAPLANQNAPCQISDQTAQMRRLILIFAGRTFECTFSDVAADVVFISLVRTIELSVCAYISKCLHLKLLVFGNYFYYDGYNQKTSSCCWCGYCEVKVKHIIEVTTIKDSLSEVPKEEELRNKQWPSKHSL